MPSTRRELVARSAAVAALLLAAGVLPVRAGPGSSRAAFDARSFDEAVEALGIDRPVASADIALTAPDVAENGAVVPVAAETTLPGVRRLLLLVEKNPTALIADFDFSDAVDTRITTCIKMAESSNVYAVALLADGRVLYAVKNVTVMPGGCG